MEKIDAVMHAILAAIAIICVFVPIILPYRIVKWLMFRKPIFGEGYNRNTFFGD